MLEKLKWTYTFFLLIVTIGWAVFLIMLLKNCAADPASITVQELIGASGVSVLLGALIAWCGNVNQYWFRKNLKE